MTFAVIRLGGKQFKVQEGTKVTINRQDKPVAEVLMYSEKDKVSVGDPILKGYEVTLKKVEDGRAKKVRVARFKSKSRYRKVKGHRQPISTFEVLKVGKKSSTKASAESAEVKKEEKVEKKATAKKSTTTKKTATKKPTTKKKVESSTAKAKKADTAPKKRGRPAKKKE